MPCRCDDEPSPLDGYLTSDPEEREKLLSDMFYHVQRQRDDLTGMLCDFVQCFIKSRKIPEKVYNWAEEHCLFDQKEGRAWPLTLDDLSDKDIDSNQPRFISYRPMKSFKRNKKQ